LKIEYLMNRYALSFLNRQHSTNIQYAIENIQSLEGDGESLSIVSWCNADCTLVQYGLSRLRRDFFTADLQHLQWRIRMQHQGDTTLSGLK
jgi:hypothetical protein